MSKKTFKDWYFIVPWTQKRNDGRGIRFYYWILIGPAALLAGSLIHYRFFAS